MRCKKEEFKEETLFHIYNRSVAKTDLFCEYDDYTYFLAKLKENLKQKQFEIFAYCLMPNHFHFCIQQNTEVQIYKLFNKVNTSYSMHYNRKYKRNGKLFAGKLQHKQLYTDKYLIGLCQYIHYNPVKAGLVENASEWKFSNYSEYISNNDNNEALYSKTLIKMYPEIFQDYQQSLIDYHKYINEDKFFELLIDYE